MHDPRSWTTLPPTTQAAIIDERCHNATWLRLQNLLFEIEYPLAEDALVASFPLQPSKITSPQITSFSDAVYFFHMPSTAKPQFSESALIKEARVLAVQLAEALVASNLPQQEKEAWAALLPELRLDQLSRLAAVLDASVEKAARADVADVVEKLRGVLEKHAAIQSQLDSSFMGDISGIVQELRKAEAAQKD